MGAGLVVKGAEVVAKGAWSALKAVGKWVSKNPAFVMDAADRVIKVKTEDKVDQLGAAVLELDEKIDAEINSLHKQLRTMKIAFGVMGAVLVSAVVAIILLAL